MRRSTRKGRPSGDADAILMSHDIVIAIDPRPLPTEVLGILQFASWARGRTAEQIRSMLQQSVCVVVARRAGRLVGFGRAWGDGVFRAVIDDVVVIPEERGNGLGSRIIRRLLEALVGVEEISLSTSRETAAFYAKLGFRVFDGAHMKKMASPGLETNAGLPPPSSGEQTNS
jgi:predicted N-acetyltransferase YhbS